MVHRREIEGREVVFGNQGDLYLNAMTWFDHDTGSVWSQPSGEAIIGPLTGTKLELLPSSLSTWADWKRLFPDTLALDVTTRGPVFDVDRQAVVVASGGDTLAVTIPDLRDVGIVNETVGGEPVVLALLPGSDRPVVWTRTVEGEAIEFDLIDGVLVDPAGRVEFDARRGVGPGGLNLDAVPSFGSFPADYSRLWPQGRVWRSTGAIPAAQYSDAPPRLGIGAVPPG